MWEALATRSWTCSSAQAAERGRNSLDCCEDVCVKVLRLLEGLLPEDEEDADNVGSARHSLLDML